MSGSAEHTLDLLKQAIQEINRAGEERGKKNLGEQLLSHVKNTMTDRASVNTKFNTMLQTYRTGVLPIVKDNWDSISAEEKAALSRVNNHFCGLHMLVNLAELCSTVLLQYEQSILGKRRHIPCKHILPND